MKRWSTLSTIKDMQIKTKTCAKFTYQIGNIFKSSDTQRRLRFGETWICQAFDGSEESDHHFDVGICWHL